MKKGREEVSYTSYPTETLALAILITWGTTSPIKSFLFLLVGGHVYQRP